MRTGLRLMSFRASTKKLAATLVCMSAAALAGCGLGVDDVQLNGKLFDAVGLNNKAERAEPKLKERSAIVMPPNVAALPEPGVNPDRDIATGSIAEVRDHDEVRQVTKADLERKQAEYCKKHYDDAKAHGDNDVDLAEGPLGPCRGSIFSAIKKINGSGEPQLQEGQ
jgi:hypothetical protein